jgi:Cu/Ag efflux protein CusF
MPGIAQTGTAPPAKSPGISGGAPAAKAPAPAKAAPAPASGQAAVAKGPGAVGAAQTVKATATVTAIDYATREVTLKGAQGREMTIVAGPEVKRLEQVKVGDQVNAEYVEALTVKLQKGGGKAVGRTEQTRTAAAKPGAAPGAVAGRRVKIVADVIDVNPATQTLTLRGARKTVEVKVRDPEQFKLISKGDQIEATYTEAMAIAVDPVKSAAK